ncbi:NAG5 [Candida pseudojiufengensis]|uniref:NAG5 n=1 Tax=Candida pseudojiufengensis TaxID=497109 RepID=UPI0022245A61|nr:NAG5 [Candida pseudojiufengensis]KAI5961438.1 NAG5 [Candida pseudojiufengensis]
MVLSSTTTPNSNSNTKIFKNDEKSNYFTTNITISESNSSSFGNYSSPSSPNMSSESINNHLNLSTSISSTSTNETSNSTTNTSTNSSLLDSIVDSFIKPLTNENLNLHSNLILEDFKESLSKDSITMLPNYNISPTGDEKGSYLVVDLGGSTLRVAIVNIESPTTEKQRKDRLKIIIEDKWIIPNEFKILNYNFFRFIGFKIMETLEKQDLINISDVINTGITWSFPLDTTSYNNGKIRHVSKGYTIDSDIYDKDLKLIFESILFKEFNLKIDIKLISNDSLAVYSAGTFLDDKMKLAMVLGTGFNMCCQLQTPDKNATGSDDTPQMHPKKLIDSKILINTELSLFGQNLCNIFSTKYDGIIDSRFNNFKHHFKTFLSQDPENNLLFQPNELMTSGRYLPELNRLIIIDLINNGEILSNFNKSELHDLLEIKYDGFNGELMCFINESNDYEQINLKFKKFYKLDKNLKNSDIDILKIIIESILKRASFIIANSIIAFFKLFKIYNTNETNKGLITIGYVGSVLNFFNNYRKLIIDYVNNSSDAQTQGYSIDLKLIDNSSIIGAAIGAAYYSK